MSEYERLVQDRRDADRARERKQFLTKRLAERGEELEQWKDRAEKAQAECAELAEAMRRIGIEQFEANAARLKAEETLREIRDELKDADKSDGQLLLAITKIVRTALSEKAP